VDAPTTVTQMLQAARQLGVARLDTLALLEHHTQRARTWLLAHDDEPLQRLATQRVLADLRARLDDVPLAYLVGHKGFANLTLQVNASVLVPRPETEGLVAWALTVLASDWGHVPAPVVVDLGTGSGAIALALQQACPRAQVHAVDASPAALAVAKTNADALGLPITLHHGNWWQGGWLSALPGPIHVLVSNPPYVAEGDGHLHALRHEPRSALVSGRDGMDDIAAIVAGAKAALTSRGHVLLEHGHTQGEAVRAAMVRHHLTDVSTRQDLSGQPRCTGGRTP
jgi:release factor glutamine methyltransferase